MPTLRTARRRRAIPVVLATFVMALLTAVPVAAADGVPPTVVSTTPADGATGVAVGATLSVTFSEPVNVTGNWFSVVCDASSNHLSAAAGGPTTWSIDPVNNFVAGEACRLTIVATNVTDQDGDGPMAADVVVGFTVATETTPPTGGPGSGSTGGFELKRPTKATPAVNKAKAGSRVHVTFTFDGDGHTFTAATQAYTCGSTPPTTATDPAVIHGPAAIRANRHHDTYTVTWKTKKAWKHTCRVLVLEAQDGQTQAIAFRFN